MSDTTTIPEEWAQIEVFGHRRHFGRVQEVERFGAKLLRIDVPTADPAVFETHFYGGSAIFSMTPCTEAVARAYAERDRPRSYQPQSVLPAPVHDDDEDEYDDPADRGDNETVDII